MRENKTKCKCTVRRDEQKRSRKSEKRSESEREKRESERGASIKC